MPKSKLTAASTIEAELAGLITTRTNLQARQSALAAEVEKAVTTRRRLLIEGGDASAIAEAERACREIEGTTFGVADALAEVERRITATEERIEQDRILSERESTAAALERDSQAIDAAAERVRQAAGALAAANAALARAITPTASPLFAKRDMHGMRDGEPPERVAAYLTGHMIATVLPQIEVSEAGRQERFGYVSAKTIEAIDGETPARSLLTDPLRELAAQVRAGEASPQVRRYVVPEPDFMPPPESMEVYVTERFSYLPKSGYAPEPVSIGKQRLPEPVALLAIKQGLAFEVEPVGWAAVRSRAQATANQQRSPADYPPIGFNLQEWREAEAKRAREAWLAEQGREAA